MKFLNVFSALFLFLNLNAQLHVDYWTKAIDDFKINNYHGAITYLDKYLSIVPNDPNAIYNRGISKLNLGDLKGACLDITRAENLGFKSANQLKEFLCDSDFKLKLLQRQFYDDEELIPENNYRPLYTRKDSLRGALRPERTCFDVYFYDLKVKIIPKGKKIEGENKIYFHVVNPTNRIQIDLFDIYTIHRISMENTPLKYTREFNALFIDFPFELNSGNYVITINYSGKPDVAKRPPWQGGFVWKKDRNGHVWAGVACEHLGASSWWPNKDHLSDEPDSMKITLEVPSGYTAVSNGFLRNSTDLNKKTKQFEWFVNYPINNYNVTFYLGKFSYFTDTMKIGDDDLLMKYYVLPYNLEKAEDHFKQSEKVVDFYSRVFGEYPFIKDGFGLVESPYEGMEHQTAIAYGNSYSNTKHNLYRKKEFDYIIVHEAAHEWWGNAVSSADMADIWLHEGFATYAELLFIEDMYGKEEYDFEMNDKRKFIYNFWPVVENYHVNENSFASNDVYTKGAMILHTLRCTINDDSLFFGIVKNFFEQNKYKIITSAQFISFVNESTQKDFTAFFDKYLLDTELPVLAYKLKYNSDGKLLFTYWWEGVKDGFFMPFAVHTNNDTSLRFEGTTKETEVVLEGTEWFRFYNEWQEVKNAAPNSLTYFRTRWAKEE